MSNQQQSAVKQPETALVPVETSTAINALVPTTIDGAMQFARWLAQSSLLPKSVNKEHDIFFIITAGMEIGIPPMAALRSLYCVNGRTALESRAKMALCLSKGAAQYFKRVEYTPEATTWETLRKGQTEPVRSRYTRQEAIAAFLAPGPNPDGKGPAIAGKEGPWRLYTQRMISHRALGWLCDDVYPDIVLGVATAEDFDQDEFTFRPITAGVELLPSPAQQQQQRSPAPVGPPPGVPSTAKHAGPAPEAAAKTETESTGPALESQEEIDEIVERIGKFTNEKELRAYCDESIRPRQMTDVVRNKLLNAYGDQIDLIREDAKANKAKGK